MKGILRLVSLVGLVALAGTPSADAVPFVIDFESELTGSGLGSLVIASGPITATFDRTSSATFGIQNINAFMPSFGSRTLEPFSGGFPGDSFVLTFSLPIYQLSIQFSDSGPSDNDTPVGLAAFSGPSGTGVPVSSDAASWLGTDGFPNFKTLSINSAFAFQSVTFTNGGPFPNSLYWDNIEGNTDPAVPEPGTLLLLGSGITGIALRRRRRNA